MPERTCDAVLLDIDGTLVDTNWLHVDAWSRALDDVGRTVETWRVQRVIGMDSGRLIGELLGDEADRLGAEVKERHAHHYERDVPRMHVLDAARDLLSVLAERGFRVVLATSAPPEEFGHLVDVLQPGDTVQTVTTSDDVSQAKPAPDVMQVALERAGVAAERAVMVGDAVWDVESAEKAGVRCIGVLSGGTGRAELLGAGAVAVYNDVAALLRGLEESPLYT